MKYPECSIFPHDTTLKVIVAGHPCGIGHVSRRCDHPFGRCIALWPDCNARPFAIVKRRMDWRLRGLSEFVFNLHADRMIRCGA